MGEEVRGLRSTNRELPNIHVDAKYSVRNGVAKELIDMNHEHELWCRYCLRSVGHWMEWGRENGTTVIE